MMYHKYMYRIRKHEFCLQQSCCQLGSESRGHRDDAK